MDIQSLSPISHLTTLLPLFPHFQSQLLALVGDDALEGVVQGATGGVADQFSEFADGRDAAAHIFEAGGIGFVVGHQADFGAAAGQSQDPFGKLEDGDFFGGADVENLANGCGGFGQFDDRAGHVSHIGKAARLPAIAVNGDGFAAQGLAHKARHNHAIATGLAWSDGVEEAHDDHRQSELGVVGQAEEFVHGFGGGIGPATVGGGAHQPVIVLAEGHFDPFAVDFGGGGDQDFTAVAIGGGQHGFAAHDVGGNRANGVLDDQLDAYRGGQMDDGAGLAGKAVEHLVIGDGLTHELEVGQGTQVSDVLDAPGGKVVDSDHVMPLVDEPLTEMAADEASSAGDEDGVVQWILLAGETRFF